MGLTEDAQHRAHHDNPLELELLQQHTAAQQPQPRHIQQQQNVQERRWQRLTPEPASSPAAEMSSGCSPTAVGEDVSAAHQVGDVGDQRHAHELCGAVASSFLAITPAQQLAMASEAVGAWARGPVSAAIRARAIVRLVTGRAVRRLVYLHEDIGRDEVRAVSSVNSETSSHERRLRRRSASTAQSAKPLGFRRRPNRVPENSVLGQMILRDPERAAKYNLIAVPAWGRGTSSFIHQPVCLPHLSAHDGIERKNLDIFDMHAKSEFGMEDAPESSSHSASSLVSLQSLEGGSSSSPVSDLTLNPRWKKVQSAGRLLGRFRTRTAIPLRDDGSEDHADSALLLNFSSVFSSLSDEQEDLYMSIFERHAEPFAKGTLSRKGMQRALNEAGLTPSKGSMQERMKEQQMLKSLQEQVILYSRSNDDNELLDPIKDNRGEWALDEFLLIVAGTLELRRKERERDDKLMAKRYHIPVQEVDQLRKIFVRYDADASGSIDLAELSTLLHEVNLHPTDGEVQMILGDMKLDENGELNFGEFLQVMRSVAENLQPDRQWRKQSSMASNL